MFDLHSKRFRAAFVALALVAGTVMISPASLALKPSVNEPASPATPKAGTASQTTTSLNVPSTSSHPSGVSIESDNPTLIKSDSSAKELGDKVVLKDGKLVRQVDPAQEQLARTQALDHFDLSRFYFSQFDLKMSEMELEAAIMYMPLMKAAHRDYCIVSLLTGHPMRALAELMMVFGAGEPVPLTEPEKVELKARGAKMHYRKALEYGRKEKWDNAIAELQWALDFTPANASIKRSLAFALASKGEFDMAEETYKESISENPSDPYAHADFAFLLSDKGDQNEAFTQLSEAVKLAPKTAALHVDLAWMAETKGDLTLASAELEQAIKISPTYAGLWVHLGRVDERKGDVDSAIAAYNRALNVDPSQAEAKQRLEVLKSANSKAKSVEPGQADDSSSGVSKTGKDRPKESTRSNSLNSDIKTSSKINQKSL